MFKLGLSIHDNIFKIILNSSESRTKFNTFQLLGFKNVMQDFLYNFYQFQVTSSNL